MFNEYENKKLINLINNFFFAIDVINLTNAIKITFSLRWNFTKRETCELN